MRGLGASAIESSTGAGRCASPNACVVCGGCNWTSYRSAPDLSRPSGATMFTVATCCSCGHFAQIPSPDESQLAAAYSAEYAPYRPAWKEPGWPLWKLFRQLTTKRRLRRLRKHSCGRKLLEVGCGAGDFLCAAGRAGWQVSAVEYSARAVAEIQRELALDVKAGELISGLWPSGHFDVVALWSVLEHIRDPRKFLATVSDYVASDGVVLIQIPTRAGAELGKIFGPHWALLELPRHLNFFSGEALARICEESGLRLVSFKTPLLDTLWCYATSCTNQAAASKGSLDHIVKLLTAGAMVVLSTPWLAIKSWRGLGTEAFAVAIKA